MFCGALIMLHIVLALNSCATKQTTPDASTKEDTSKQWLYSALDAPVIWNNLDTPERRELLLQYCKDHYGVSSTLMEAPEIIMVHATYIDGFRASFNAFAPLKLNPQGRSDIIGGGEANVAIHFLVSPEGNIHQLMPLNQMARHAVGYNHNSIGIELVAKSNKYLTKAQLSALSKLIVELKQVRPSLKYLVGHHEYLEPERAHYFLYRELDKNYKPPTKYDPGSSFMNMLRTTLHGDYNLDFLD